MSLSERLKSRRTPEPLPGLSRSRSFAGLLAGNQHRRTASATANFASLGSGGSDAGSVSSLGSSGSGDHHHHRPCNGTSSGGSVSAASTLSRATNILGQSHSPNTTRRLLQGFSATWGGKPPPAPRPQRAVTIFQSTEKGLRECIHLTQKDITNLKSSVDSLSVNSSQQLKTAERYLKRLEYQSAKLEELSEQYDVQQRMRDGVRSMAYAFVLNPGKERDSALHNVRSGFKECTDILCGIETELERMMGTLMFQLKGIQGFARLCAGDVFEITIKHGEQKWKTRGRILKNEKQIWDNPRAIFKALMGEMLYIKAVEVRTLSKNILLGHKYCETKDLFSAHPQMMTVNLNPSGSLKLHVVITWNPLHGCPEELSPKPMPPLLAALQSPMMKRRAPLPPNSTVAVHEDLHSPSSHDPLLSIRSMVHQPSIDLESPLGSISSESSRSASAVTTPDAPEVLGLNIPCPTVETPNNMTIQELVTGQSSQDIRDKSRWDSSDCCSVDLGSLSQGSHQEGCVLHEVVHNLISTLEDIQGQYPELHSLEQHVMELDKILRRDSSRRGSTSSSVSISVESALGCFDFLNSAIDSDETEFGEDRIPSEAEKGLDPDLTAKTSDSGIASLARQLMDDNGRSSTPCSFMMGPSPQPSSTGSEQLDLALATHLAYCQRLLEHLGSFGPLKCRELFSLDKLRRQASAIGTLLKMAATAKEERRTVHGSSLLPEGSETMRLWDLLTGGEPLCITADQMLGPLEHVVTPHMPKDHVIQPISVSKLFVCRVVDSERYEPEAVVSVLQLQLFVSHGSSSVGHHVKALVEEVSLIEFLHSPDPLTVKKTLASMRHFVPPHQALLTVGHMLVGQDPTLLKAAESYIGDIAKNTSIRKQVSTVFLEGLESSSPLTRQGSCGALAILVATEYTDQLVFLCYADESAKVRQQAKDALFSFGDEGRKAFEQAQLFTHGFQGLSVQ